MGLYLVTQILVYTYEHNKVLNVSFIWRCNTSKLVSSHHPTCDPLVNFWTIKKMNYLLNLFRCYSSHLSVCSICYSWLLPLSEFITQKAFIPCQPVYLYAQIHFTVSFLSLLYYMAHTACLMRKAFSQERLKVCAAKL